MQVEALIGLDIGDRRIGIAVSTSGILVTPLETYTRKTMGADADYIAALAKKYGTKRIIAGLPVHDNGDEHEQAVKNELLLVALRERGMLIDYFDESYSSQEADEAMLEYDLTRKQRKRNVDRLAAGIILQHYIDSKKEK